MYILDVILSPSEQLRKFYTHQEPGKSREAGFLKIYMKIEVAFIVLTKALGLQTWDPGM